MQGEEDAGRLQNCCHKKHPRCSLLTLCCSVLLRSRNAANVDELAASVLDTEMWMACDWSTSQLKSLQG